MAMTVNEKYVKEWLNKLPGFDPLDPKPGHYHIFLCPETGMVFKAREETKVTKPLLAAVVIVCV